MRGLRRRRRAGLRIVWAPLKKHAAVETPFPEIGKFAPAPKATARRAPLQTITTKSHGSGQGGEHAAEMRMPSRLDPCELASQAGSGL